jgi:hypothetical protein
VSKPTRNQNGALIFASVNRLQSFVSVAPHSRLPLNGEELAAPTVVYYRPVSWQNTTLIFLSITLAVAAVVGSLARQLFGSIFDLEEEIERGDDDFSRAARDPSTDVGTPVGEAARNAPVKREPLAH